MPVKRYGKACTPSERGAVTCNQTLIRWLPRLRTIEELLAAGDAEKAEPLKGSEPAKVRVAYQVRTAVTWAGATDILCGRTFEEAFGLENAVWVQAPEQRPLGLKLKAMPADAAALARGLHKRVIGRGFDKTKFALGVLAADEDAWAVPLYIRQGLGWLKEQVDLEVKQEVEALAEAVSAAEGSSE